MKKSKLLENILAFVVITILVFLSVFNLLSRKGHPITFDGHIHMTTMNQFAQSLRDKELPVTWSNNFANFGLPLPLFAHQLPAYLGAVLILFGLSTETAFIALVTISVLLSSYCSFFFFKKLTNTKVALVATTISIYFPYKELNIYTRGALPELMSAIFLPIIFCGLYYLKKQNYKRAGILIALSIFATALAHPMMLLVFAIPSAIYFFSNTRKKYFKKEFSTLLISILLGVLTASYYLLPLILEMKYFYQGMINSSISLDRFLQLKQLFDPTWYYTLTHPGPRGNYIKLGIIEFVIFLTAVATLLLTYFNKLKKVTIKKENKELLIWTMMATVSIALLLPFTQGIYKLPFFSQIQYPWRFLNTLQFLIPGLFIMLTKTLPKLSNKKLLLFFVFIILYLRLPQFYGKNYISQPESDYEFNKANLHSLNMNTLWSDNSENYPTKTIQAEVVEGDGVLTPIDLKNASREYVVNASSQVKVVDYTFYFPGWKVKNQDGDNINIEYQSPLYRGLITYILPAGNHHLYLKYEVTKVRMLGNMLSILGVFSSLVILLYLNKTK